MIDAMGRDWEMELQMDSLDACRSFLNGRRQRKRAAME